jgi:predicted ATPase
VALFIQRAMRVKPELVINDEQTVVIADICRRVDGLPLAIELAAARVTHLPLVGLLDRLQHRLQVLTGGSRDLPPRQQRMRDTISWSHDLLGPQERALFRRLSVFVGSWSLRAAEEICGLDECADEFLDSLRLLVDSSLVVATVDNASEPRYRMLDTIHEYAAEQLADSNEYAEMRQRHGKYYVDLAEQAEPALQDRAHQVWYPLLEREHDNIRVSLGWLLKKGEVESALRLAGAVWRYWQRHGDIREGRYWLEEGLAKGDHISWPVLAKALWAASWLAYYQGDFARTRSLSYRHLAAARAADDALSTRNALTGLGMVALAEERYEEAAARLQEALDVCRPLGPIWHRATSFLNLGNAIMLTGDLSRAAALFEEALSLYQERGDEVFTARAQQHLGYVSLLQGDYERARALFTESLQALFSLGEKPGVADGLEAVAALRAVLGEVQKAGQLVEAAAALREVIGVAPLTYLRPLWYPFLVKAEEESSATLWRIAQKQGREMSLREAVALAVSWDP